MKALKNLPVPVQLALVGVGGLAVFFVGRKIFKALRKKPGGPLVTAAQGDIAAILKANPNLPPMLQQTASHSPAQMKSFADNLERAMKGWGTREKDIDDVLMKMNNDLDLLLLIEAFGVRDEDNLTQWLQDDGYIEGANKVLATKPKVTFRF